MGQDHKIVRIPEVDWERAEEFVAGVSNGSIRPKVDKLEEELSEPVTQVYRKE